jgi:small subunit ribosomal protein S1
MQILVVEKAGFCFGVKRAIKLAFEAAQKSKERVYTWGPLIHNPQVVEELKKEGVEVIDELDNLKNGILVIRSHGIHPEVLKKIKQRGIKVIDATCPFVKNAQNKAKSLSEAGYLVAVVGESHHPEVKGIVGYAQNNAVVLSNNLANFDFSKIKRIGVVAQTTLDFATFQKACEKLLKKVKELRIYNTICNTTAATQKKTLDLCKKVDLMIVVGGKNSANTSRLTKLCQDSGKKTYHIETARTLKRSWFKNIDKVGVTAGSSTPDWIIKEIIEKIKNFNSKKNPSKREIP